jgi:hypothetical protein
MAKAIPASAFYAGGCVVLGIAGALFLASRDEAGWVNVPTPARAIEAYTAVRAEDLTMRRVRGRRLAGAVLRNQAQVIGRYGLTTLPRGVPLDHAKLGPRLPAGALDRLFITAAPLGAVAKVNARVEAGRQVTIAFTGKDTPEPIGGVWVLDVAADGAAVVLAIPLERRSDFARGSPQGFLIGAVVGHAEPVAKAEKIPPQGRSGKTK